jgi:hypothetical protein
MFRLRIGLDNNTIGTISNVSVKELGADWASQDGNIDTYNENGVTITSINADNDNRLSQNSVTEDGKSYKVTYTIHATSFSTGTVFEYFDGDFYRAFPEQGVGTHTFYFTRIGTDDFWNLNLDASSSGSLTDFVTLSSISVKELGEDWIVGSGWSIGEDKAIASPATDYLYQEDVYDKNTIKTYKLTYTITVDSGKFVVLINGKTGSTFFEMKQ